MREELNSEQSCTEVNEKQYRFNRTIRALKYCGDLMILRDIQLMSDINTAPGGARTIYCNEWIL